MIKKKDLKFYRIRKGEVVVMHRPLGLSISGCTEKDAVSRLKEWLNVNEQRRVAAARKERRAKRKAEDAEIIKAFELRTGVDCSKIPRSSKAMKKILKEGRGK